MNRLADLLLVSRAEVSRHKNVAAHGDAYKKINQKIDQSRRGANGREGLAASEPSDHDDVRCIKQELQDAGLTEFMAFWQDILEGINK